MVGIKRQARMLVKQSICNLLPERKMNQLNDICVFSSRRGGSTWLMQTLCAHPGLRYVDQPFSYYSAPTFLQEALPLRQCSAFFHLSDEEEVMVENYFRSVLLGKLNINSRWDLWNSGFWKRPDRIVTKIVDAKGLISWLQLRFHIDVIYQVRHPIAQALSVERAGWENGSKAYLDSKWFVDNHLTSEQYELAREILTERTPLEGYVLNWCFDNMLPLRSIDEHPEWMLVSYEEMLEKPREVIQLLINRCGLEAGEAMLKQVSQPSRTAQITNDSTDGLNSKSKISKWRERVDEEMESRCMEIVSAMGIDAYVKGRDLPISSLLNFEGASGVEETREPRLAS